MSVTPFTNRFRPYCSKAITIPRKKRLSTATSCTFYTLLKKTQSMVLSKKTILTPATSSSKPRYLSSKVDRRETANLSAPLPSHRMASVSNSLSRPTSPLKSMTSIKQTLKKTIQTRCTTRRLDLSCKIVNASPTFKSDTSQVRWVKTLPWRNERWLVSRQGCRIQTDRKS